MESKSDEPYEPIRNSNGLLEIKHPLLVMTNGDSTEVYFRGDDNRIYSWSDIPCNHPRWSMVVWETDLDCWLAVRDCLIDGSWEIVQQTDEAKEGLSTIISNYMIDERKFVDIARTMCERYNVTINELRDILEDQIDQEDGQDEQEATDGDDRKA